MSAAVLVAELEAAGFRVAIDGMGRLTVAPRNRLSQEQRARLQAKSPEVVRYLRANGAEPSHAAWTWRLAQVIRDVGAMSASWPAWPVIALRWPAAARRAQKAQNAADAAARWCAEGRVPEAAVLAAIDEWRDALVELAGLLNRTEETIR